MPRDFYYGNAECCNLLNDICDICSKCVNCCVCNEPVFTFYPVQFVPKTTFNQNKSQRYIGCELEIVESRKFNDIYKFATKNKLPIVQDHSISDEEFGFEMLTQPACGDSFLYLIKDLTDIFSRTKCEVDGSCGYHVHIDARDFDYYDIQKLVLIYYKIESALFLAVPPKRRCNDVCGKCGKEYFDMMFNKKSEKVLNKYSKRPKNRAKHKLLNGLYDFANTNRKARYIRSIRGEKYMECRYRALNLHSYFTKGTIECRLAPGTVNYEDIVYWAMMWAQIIDYAKKSTEVEIKTKCFELDFLEEILSEDTFSFVKSKICKYK